MALGGVQVQQRDKRMSLMLDTRDKRTHEIFSIVERAMQGTGLTDEEAKKLYAVNPDSSLGAYVTQAGRELTFQSSNGRAEVHAQIGLNGSPCPKNCTFCSFAVCNGVRSGKLEIGRKEVIEYAKIYEDSGANALLLLCTASYKFEKLLEMLSAVREVISKDMPLLANTGDMTLEEAQQVKAAGANGCYHAVRMGEGLDTTIPVETRLESFKNIRAAGLTLSTCVEPVGPEHSIDELVEKTRICIESEALSAGVGRRIEVPGTLMFDRGMITSFTAGFYIAVYRLVTGLFPRLNCSGGTELMAGAGANLAWAEVGTNPRDTKQRTEDGGRAMNIEQCRKVFIDAGYELLEGPSPGWILD